MLRKSMTVGISVVFFGALLTGAMAQQFRHQGMMQQAGQGMAGTQCHLQLDLSSKTELTGTVQSVSMEPGKGMPSFVMLANGKSVTVVVSPYRALTNAGLEVRAGDTVSVQAYRSQQATDTYVAAELTNGTSGKHVVLRDESGFPTAGRGLHHGAGSCPCYQ